VDDIDLDILRWMYPGGVWSPGGTDPRITATDIASHVGLQRTAVWDRVRKWRREGFWDGYEVHLNFAIFGVGMAYAEIQVADAAEGLALFDKLEQVEGVLGASLHSGDSATTWGIELVAVMMVSDTPTQIARRMRILRRLSPRGRVNGPYIIGAPHCSREPTPLDWRIIAAIVADPNASLSEQAHRVGVTLKTFVRHHSALLDDKAATYAPKVDWSKLGCVSLGIYCRGTGDVDRVRRVLEVRFPHSIPMSLEGLGNLSPGYDPSCCFGVIVPARSPHGILTLVPDISRIPGVRLVRPELWGPRRSFDGWIYQHIAEHLASPPALLPKLAPRPRGRKGRRFAIPPAAREFELSFP